MARRISRLALRLNGNGWWNVCVCVCVAMVVDRSPGRRIVAHKFRFSEIRYIHFPELVVVRT